MSIDERIPGYSDKELASLRDNVQRLALAGTIPQRAEAERLMPLIDAETETRKARAPVRAERKTPVRKAPVPKKAKAKAKVEDAPN
jgi:hypothetical protein